MTKSYCHHDVECATNDSILYKNQIMEVSMKFPANGVIATKDDKHQIVDGVKYFGIMSVGYRDKIFEASSLQELVEDFCSFVDKLDTFAKTITYYDLVVRIITGHQPKVIIVDDDDYEWDGNDYVNELYLKSLGESYTMGQLISGLYEIKEVVDLEWYSNVYLNLDH